MWTGVRRRARSKGSAGMGAAAYVGRIGVLALALGIGTAVVTGLGGATARADATDAVSPSASESSAATSNTGTASEKSATDHSTRPSASSTSSGHSDELGSTTGSSSASAPSGSAAGHSESTTTDTRPSAVKEPKPESGTDVGPGSSLVPDADSDEDSESDSATSRASLRRTVYTVRTAEHNSASSTTSDTRELATPRTSTVEATQIVTIGNPPAAASAPGLVSAPAPERPLAATVSVNVADHPVEASPPTDSLGEVATEVMPSVLKQY